MALGRVSPFKQLEQPRASTRGENLTGSAFEDMQTTADADPLGNASPADGGSAASPSFSPSLTGTDPSLSSMFGQVALSGVPGLGTVTGPLGASLAGPIGGLIGSLAGNVAQSRGLQALSAIGGPNVSSSISPNVSNIGLIGGSTPFGSFGSNPSSITGNLAAALGAALGISGFSSPSFAGTTTAAPTAASAVGVPSSFGSLTGFGLTGDPTIGHLSAAMMGNPSLAAAPTGFGSFTGLGFGGKGGTGIGTVGEGVAAAGNPAGGYGNPSQFGLANSPAVRGSDPVDPDLSDPTGIVGVSSSGGGVTGSGGTGAGPAAGSAAAAGVGETGGVAGIGLGEGGTIGDTGISGIGGSDASGPTGDSGPGVASGSGEAGIGDAGVGSGGPSGDGGVGVGDGSGGVYHQGGFVDLEQENQGPFGDPGRMGQPEDSQEAREGQITVEDGEAVINKEAAGRFGPLLNKMNEIGRNQQLKDVLTNILRGAAKTGLDALIHSR